MACNAFYNLYQLHSILNKPFIFTLSSFIKPEEIIYSIVVKMTLDSGNPISNQKNKGGRPLGTIWEDINQGQSVALGKFSASCKYCEELGIVKKFQNLKNIYQIIAKVLQQMS